MWMGWDIDTIMNDVVESRKSQVLQLFVAVENMCDMHGYIHTVGIHVRCMYVCMYVCITHAITYTYLHNIHTFHMCTYILTYLVYMCTYVSIRIHVQFLTIHRICTYWS